MMISQRAGSISAAGALSSFSDSAGRAADRAAYSWAEGQEDRTIAGVLTLGFRRTDGAGHRRRRRRDRMRILYTAIIHLRDPARADCRAALDFVRGQLRGITRIEFQPVESLIAAQFDPEQTCLAEIVRAIEDAGVQVSGVAQRRELPDQIIA
jgi:hypothetical protein